MILSGMILLSCVTSNAFGVHLSLEECPSGRWSTLGKRVNVKTFREFESHLLRIFCYIHIFQTIITGIPGFFDFARQGVFFNVSQYFLKIALPPPY